MRQSIHLSVKEGVTVLHVHTDLSNRFFYCTKNIWRIFAAVGQLKCEGRTVEYWPSTLGQYSPVRLKQARLVRSLYGTWAMLVLNLPDFENKRYTAYDRFHVNSPYWEIPTKKEPIRMLGLTSGLPCHIIKYWTLSCFRVQISFWRQLTKV